MLKSPKVFQFFVTHCCLFTCHICILFSVSSLPNAFYFVVLVVKMPEMAHDWWNKIILFYSIYSIRLSEETLTSPNLNVIKTMDERVLKASK